jgi:hypothetical protein
MVSIEILPKDTGGRGGFYEKYLRSTDNPNKPAPHHNYGKSNKDSIDRDFTQKYRR